MNKYIVKVEKYFGSYTNFAIEAESKEEAKNKVTEKIKIYDSYKLDTLKVKKVQSFNK